MPMVALSKILISKMIFMIFFKLGIIIALSLASEEKWADSGFALIGMERFDKVRLTEGNYERVRNMHVNWYAAGVKALMGKLGRELYGRLANGERRLLAQCLDRVEDRKDLVQSAKCLSTARKAHLRRRAAKKLKMGEDELLEKGSVRSIRQKFGRSMRQRKAKRKLIRVHKLQRSRRTTEEERRKGMREWAQRLNRFHHKSKNETKHERNESGPKERQSKWTQEHTERVPKFKKCNNLPKQVKQADHLEKLAGDEDRSAIIRVLELVSKLLGKGAANSTSSGVRWTQMYESLVRLKRANDRRRELPGAGINSKMAMSPLPIQHSAVYERRMYDLVLDNDGSPTLGPREKSLKQSPNGLLQMGMSLLNKLPNGGSQRNSNFKLLSPRVAPLMPDARQADSSILSPTVFALYECEKGKTSEEVVNGTERPLEEKKLLESLASAHNMLRTAGMRKEDREALLHSLMELSGSIGHVQEAMELLKSLNFFGKSRLAVPTFSSEIEPDIAEANDRILKAYKKMESTFDAEQEREIEHEGWTFLRQRQFDQLCSDQRAEFPIELRTKVGSFASLNRAGRENALWRRIEWIARNIPDVRKPNGRTPKVGFEAIAEKLDRRKSDKWARLHLDGKERRRRQRRQTSTNGTVDAVGQWSIGNPVYLQPFMFTPNYEWVRFEKFRSPFPRLTVLGPLILSPNLFSPVILAPSVLSPYILSPAAPIPFVLSPYVLAPFILSPMALAPFVLTPYVLSPNILNPYVLSPLILSPTVLSPDILSPQIFGGAILSPSVGSPAVLTETWNMTSVLSPSVLS